MIRLVLDEYKTVDEMIDAIREASKEHQKVILYQGTELIGVLEVGVKRDM